jgi:hypothetical protein
MNRARFFSFYWGWETGGLEFFIYQGLETLFLVLIGWKIQAKVTKCIT